MDSGYFYDSNYHLNNSGVTYRTYFLIGDIKRQLNDFSKINYEIEKPAGYAPIEVIEEDDNELQKSFTYIKNESGGITIMGLTDVGKQKSILQLPKA